MNAAQLYFDTAHQPMPWKICHLALFAAISHWEPQIVPALAAFPKLRLCLLAVRTPIVLHCHRNVVQVPLIWTPSVIHCEGGPIMWHTEPHIALSAIHEIIVNAHPDDGHHAMILCNQWNCQIHSKILMGDELHL